MIRMRHLIGAAAAAMLALPAVAQEKVVWWDFLAGGDGVRMKALISQFNEEHPEIQIAGTTLEWGVPFYTKVRTSAAVGQGPDVMTYHLSRIPLALEEGVLTPITDEDLAAAELTKDDFFPAAIKAASDPDGQLYAVPFDIHSLVLYYNKKYLEGTPYLDADGKLTGIKSLEDFNAALKAAKDNGSKTPLSYQTGGDGGVWRGVLHAARAAGRRVHRRWRSVAGRQCGEGDQGAPDHDRLGDGGLCPRSGGIRGLGGAFLVWRVRVPPQRRLGSARR